MSTIREVFKTPGEGFRVDTHGRPISDVIPNRITPEPNPLQRALNDYHTMESERAKAIDRARAAEAQVAALVSEVNMLREALERSDSDRIRLQAISSTLLGRLLAINDCIGGAVRAAVKDGIEAAATQKPDEGLEQASIEAQAILQRVQPQPGVEVPAPGSAPPEPPQAAGAAMPAVDWRRVQGQAPTFPKYLGGSLAESAD